MLRINEYTPADLWEKFPFIIFNGTKYNKTLPHMWASVDKHDFFIC